MRELGQLGIMAKKHHAFQLVAELLNDVKQVMHRAGIQPVFHHDILALVIELLGYDLRCRERAPRGPRKRRIPSAVASSHRDSRMMTWPNTGWSTQR